MTKGRRCWSQEEPYTLLFNVSVCYCLPPFHPLRVKQVCVSGVVYSAQFVRRSKERFKFVYGEAFQFLQKQIDRLEANLPIEDAEFNEVDPQQAPASHWRSDFNRWGSKPYSYSRKTSVEGDHFIGHSTSGSTGGLRFNEFINQLKPSPFEAQRWLKQASSDFEAMRALDKTAFPCQVCFLAHEVVEKALKAGMYRVYGLNPSSLKNHEISCHASALVTHARRNDSTQFIQIGHLTRKVDIVHEHYLQSRFPNVHPAPKAPVDVYMESDSQEAVEIAEEIWKFVNSLQSM